MAGNDRLQTSKKLFRTTRYFLYMTMQFTNLGNEAEKILHAYLYTQMPGDLDQLAWNLVGCDDKRQAEEFGGPQLLKSEVELSDHGEVVVYINTAFSGNNQALIEQMAKEYLAAFDDYVRDTVLEFKSRTGNKLEFDGRPTKYSYEITVQ